MVTLSERDLGYYIGGTSGSRRDNGLTLFVSSVQWWIQGRGQGDYDPPIIPPPPPNYLCVWIRQHDVESVIGPFTLMKAALYATEMQLTFKIILDIAR